MNSAQSFNRCVLSPASSILQVCLSLPALLSRRCSSSQGRAQRINESQAQVLAALRKRSGPCARLTSTVVDGSGLALPQEDAATGSLLGELLADRTPKAVVSCARWQVQPRWRIRRTYSGGTASRDALETTPSGGLLRWRQRRPWAAPGCLTLRPSCWREAGPW